MNGFNERDVWVNVVLFLSTATCVAMNFIIADDCDVVIYFLDGLAEAANHPW